MGSRLWRAVRGLLPLALFGVMAVLLFTRPSLFATIIESVVSLGAAFFLLVSAILLWGYLAPQSLSRLGVRMTSKPRPAFVGNEGSGSRLRVRDVPDAPLRVEWSRGNYALAIGLLAFAGPGLALLGLVMPEMLRAVLGAPWFVVAGMAAIVLFATLGLAQQLRDFAVCRPAVLVDSPGIALMRGATLVKSVPRELIDGLRVDPHAYVWTDEGVTHSYPNFVLVACLADGGLEPLCISDRRVQLDEIAAAIRSRLSLGPDRSPPFGR